MKTLLRLISLIAAFCISLHSARAADVQQNPYVDFRVKTYAIQEQYLVRLSDHQQAIMLDLEQKLIQQRWQTTAISIMIVVMVTLGLILSALQFYLDWRHKGKSSITVKLGSGSIEFSSTVIGLAILALSFWFFQAYVDRVYSIKVFDIPAIDATTFGINR